MGQNAKKPAPVHKVDTKERIKKILSTIFVAVLSFALILLFVASDVLQTRGGAGQDAVASINGTEISRLHAGIRSRVDQIQKRSKEMKYSEALRYAVYQYIQSELLRLEAGKAGIKVGDPTMETLIRDMVAQGNMTVEQYAGSYSSRERFSIEENLRQNFLLDAIRGDIMSAFRASHLEMTLGEELKRRKIALEIATLDLTRLDPVNDTLLKAYHDGNKADLREVFLPTLISVATAADAATLAAKLKAEDMKTIAAKAEIHGVKLLQVRSLGWLFAAAIPPELSTPLTTLAPGTFSKPVAVSGMQVILFLESRKATPDFAALDKDGKQALTDLYRQRHADTLQASAEKGATDRLEQLRRLVTDGKQPLPAAAARLGLTSYVTGLFGYAEAPDKALPRLAEDHLFQAAAFAAEKGELSGIIKSGSTWLVFRVTDVRTTPDPFEKLKNKNLPDKEKKELAALYQKAILDASRLNADQAAQDWIGALSRKYNVKVYNKAFNQ